MSMIILSPFQRRRPGLPSAASTLRGSVRTFTQGRPAHLAVGPGPRSRLIATMTPAEPRRDQTHPRGSAAL